ncbi:MAG: hypothetical protein ACTSV5_06810 [Promethearchaeota archaeon]
MVKYNHCEKCKNVYSTTPWIGEVHTYNGICPSCLASEKQEDQKQQEITKDPVLDKLDTEHIETMRNNHESTQSSHLEIERRLLSSLEQKANDIFSGKGSIVVLIKEIKDNLIEKAKERIGETYKSFDVNKIEAQKVVDDAENILDYLNEYKDYMDNLAKKLQDKPKMKVKTAIDKVFKESIANIPKGVGKDSFLDKKAILKTVSDKAVKWYNIYSDTKDLSELTKKMSLHPFNEIQKKLSILPFYA